MENLDELNLENDKNIQKNLDKDEKIVMSTLIFKFNDYKKR